VGHEEVDVGERLLTDWTLLDVRADSFSGLKKKIIRHFLLKVDLAVGKNREVQKQISFLKGQIYIVWFVFKLRKNKTT
jgi:hypothetical protein